MPLRLHPLLEKELDRLTENNCYYVAVALKAFVHEKLNEMDHVCKNLSCEDDATIKVQHAYLRRLGAINFMNGYARGQIRPSHKDAFHIEHHRIANYAYYHNPSLQDAESFVFSEVDDLVNDKQRLIDTISAIKTKISGYRNLNKQAYVKQFNRDIDLIRNSLFNQPFAQVANQVKSDLRELLTSLQSREHAYYDGLRLFSKRRKANSSLQPRIDTAIHMLNDISFSQ